VKILKAKQNKSITVMGKSMIVGDRFYENTNL